MSRRLVMFAGLPSTGKSVLAEHAARFLKCPLFSKDIIEAALWRSHIKSEQNSGWAAYELITSLAESQLELGQSVVLDSVASHERLRSMQRTLTVTHGARFVVVECVCSDELLHRTRLAHHTRNIPGWYEIDWNQVVDTRGRYEPCVGPRLVLDAVNPLASNVNALRAELSRASQAIWLANDSGVYVQDGLSAKDTR